VGGKLLVIRMVSDCRVKSCEVLLSTAQAWLKWQGGEKTNLGMCGPGIRCKVASEVTGCLC
jgi:hypothetical protein